MKVWPRGSANKEGIAYVFCGLHSGLQTRQTDKAKMSPRLSFKETAEGVVQKFNLLQRKGNLKWWSPVDWVQPGAGTHSHRKPLGAGKVSFVGIHTIQFKVTGKSQLKKVLILYLLKSLLNALFFSLKLGITYPSRVCTGTNTIQYLHQWRRQQDRVHPQQVCGWHQAEWCSWYAWGMGCHPEGPAQPLKVGPCEPYEVQQGWV